jgi:hypothetical protein
MVAYQLFAELKAGQGGQGACGSFSPSEREASAALDRQRRAKERRGYS